MLLSTESVKYYKSLQVRRWQASGSLVSMTVSREREECKYDYELTLQEPNHQLSKMQKKNVGKLAIFAQAQEWAS